MDTPTYTVSFKIAKAGTPFAIESGSSSVGHMWFSVTASTADGTKTNSFGFAPEKHGQPFGPGKIYKTDDANYTQTYEEVVVNITKEQYEKLIAFGGNPESFGFNLKYNGLNNCCIDFTWKAAELIGLENPEGQVLHSIIFRKPRGSGLAFNHFYMILMQFKT